MSVTQTFIPEPSTVLLFGTGVSWIGFMAVEEEQGWVKNQDRIS